MLVGDPSSWASHFISIDDRFLVRVIAVWPKCLSVLPPDAEEDVITINLVHYLGRDVEARQLFYNLEYQYEPFGFTPDGLAYSKGQIDMAVLLNREREQYLAYECKRLSVTYNGSRNSLATRYVNEGVVRFITEQYAENLPVGCMLGYVMDSDVPFALGRVLAALHTNKTPIGMTNTPAMMVSVDGVRRFFTQHVRQASGHQIEVRHSLLPFNGTGVAAAT